MAAKSKIQAELELIVTGFDSAKKAFDNLNSEAKKLGTTKLFGENLSINKEVNKAKSDLKSLDAELEGILKRVFAINSTKVNPFSQVASNKDIDRLAKDLERVQRLIIETQAKLSQLGTHGVFTNPNVAKANSFFGMPVSNATNVAAPTTSAAPTSQKFDTFLVDSKKRIEDAQAAVKAAESWIKVQKEMGTATKAQIADTERFIHTNKMMAAGLETGKPSIRNFAASLAMIKLEMKDLVFWQARWYGAKMALFAGVELPIAAFKQAISYSILLDTWRANFTRWAASSGTVTEATKTNIDSLLVEIRRVSLEVPIAFEKAAAAVEGFLGAGISPESMKGYTKNLSILTSSFPEIDMKQFGVAIVGFYNSYKDQMTGVATEAEKLTKITALLTKAQAESIARPEQFAKMAQYIGVVGNAAGFTMEQLTAMSIVVADMGIPLASASRLMGSMITALQSKRSIAALEKGLKIKVDLEVPLADNINMMMTKLQKQVGTGPLSVGNSQFLSKLVPQQVLKDFETLIKHWDEVQVKTSKLTGFENIFESLNKAKTESISGKFQLIKNTLLEVTKAAGDSGSVLHGITDVILDMSKGMLAALSPTYDTAKNLSTLGNAGKVAYDFIKAFSIVVSEVASVLKPFGQVLLFIIQQLSQFSFLLQGITFLAVISGIGKMTGAFTLSKLAVAALGLEIDKVNAKQLLNKTPITGTSGLILGPNGQPASTPVVTPTKSNIGGIGGGTAIAGFLTSYFGSQMDDKELGAIVTQVGNLATTLGTVTIAANIAAPAISAWWLAITTGAAAAGVAVLSFAGIAAALGLGGVLGALALIQNEEEKVLKQAEGILDQLAKTPEKVQAIRVELQKALEEYGTWGSASEETIKKLEAAGIKGARQLNQAQLGKLSGAGEYGSKAFAAKDASWADYSSPTASSTNNKPYMKGKSPPPDDAKKLKGGNLAGAALREEFKTELAIIKRGLEEEQAIYESMYKKGELNEETYYYNLKVIREKAYDADIKATNDHIKALQEQAEKNKIGEKDANKIKAIDDKLLADIGALEEQKLSIRSKFRIKELQEETNLYLHKRKLAQDQNVWEIENLKQMLEIKQELRQQDLDGELKQTEWLYGQGKLSAEKYYNFLKVKSEEEHALRISQSQMRVAEIEANFLRDIEGAGASDDSIVESTPKYQEAMQKRTKALRQEHAIQIKSGKTVAQEEEERIRKLAEEYGNFYDGILAAQAEWSKNSDSMLTHGKKIWTSYGQGIKSSVMMMFEDIRTGGLDSFEKYFLNFLTKISDAFNDVVSSMVANWLMGIDMMKEKESEAGGKSGAGGAIGMVLKFVMGLFGGGAAEGGGMDLSSNVLADNAALSFGEQQAWDYSYSHGGGLTNNIVSIKKFHDGGLNADERMTINKVGERYITSEQNDWLTGIANGMQSSKTEEKQSNVNYYISAVDSKSFVDMLNKNPGAITQIVGQGMTGNTALRQTMKRTR